MTLRKGWWWTLALLVLLALAVLPLLRPEVLAVEAARVERRDFSVAVEEQGRTRARNPYLVAAPVSGRLLRIQFDEGDRVSQGQALARIALAPEDRRTEAIYRAEVAAAEARLGAARATLGEAESSFARARGEEERREELFKNDLVSAEERESYRQLSDSAEARLLSARAALQAAEADLEIARSRLLGLDGGEEEGVEEILSPVAGTVFRVLEESERVVQAGTPLLEISNDDEMEVVIDLLTQDAVQVQAGDPILISGWGGGEVLHGVVRYLEPSAFTKISALGVEEQRVNVIGDLLDAPPALGAGYRIEAAIVTWEGEDVLAVPVSALFQRGGGWRVFAIGAGDEAVLRAVEIGRRGSEYAQVLGGLEEGDPVVLFPSDLVAEGVRVSY